jgi:hypothetical protein
MKNYLCILMTCVALTGCAGAVNALSDKVTTTVVEDRDVGTTPAGYEAAIKEYFKRTLKDPYSAKYEEITPPILGFFTESTVTKPATLINTDVRVTVRKIYGWMVTADVNAKNSYGGYVGVKQYKFFFRGDTLIHVVTPA